MALTIGPLLSLPFAAWLIRRAGYRYDAWVFPTALGLHWLLIRGHGTEPLYLLGVTLFVLAATGAAFAGLAGPRERAEDPARRRRRELRVVRAVETHAPPAPPAPRIARPRPLEAVPPVETAPAVQPVAAPEPIAVEAPPSRPEPPADDAELLERISLASSDAQRLHLLGRLRADEETVTLLRSKPDAPYATLGHAWTTTAHAWGDQRRDGFLVRFDGTAPRGSTVLVVLCDVSDPVGLLDASAREDLRGSALLVPSDLEGVKRLEQRPEGDARWLARAVFVPLHLLVGEPDADGRGPGHGETVTGRPS